MRIWECEVCGVDVVEEDFHKHRGHRLKLKNVIQEKEDL